ncbi:response regulator [Aquabacterium sp.]|uniref:response regulator n=1 Tax=Aquabacterium sp. TaxID=1872578 RepID=UPI0035B39DB3
MPYLYEGVENCKALIVDDGNVSRSILASQLRDLGVGNVVQARRPQDARVALERQTYDFVLCEYHFEDEAYSGQDLLDDLRRANLLPYATTFLMVTSEASYNKVAEAAEAALDGYLIKPYTANSLGDRLLHARQRKMALKDIFSAIEAGDFGHAARLCVQRFVGGKSYALYAARIGGDLLARQGHVKEAQALYQKVLDQHPRLAWAQLGMARTYVDSQQTPMARRLLHNLVKEHPDFAEGHDMLGNLEIEQGELAQARDSLKRAWDITPASISRCVRHGAASFYAGDKAEAVRPLERAATLGNGSKMFDQQSLMLLAFMRMDAKDTKGLRRTLSALDAALQNQPDSARIQRMVEVGRTLCLVAEQKSELLPSTLQKLAEQLDADDLDVEAACNLLSLLARISPELAAAPPCSDWVEKLSWRFSGNKAAATLMLAASAERPEQQARIQNILSEAQTAVQAALSQALAGQHRFAVTELISLAQKWRNAKWAEMAGIALDRHREHIADADRLEPLIQNLRNSFKGQPNRLPLGNDSGRQAGGLSLRVKVAPAPNAA